MINQEQVRKVAIVGYNRIPFARINTAYINATNQDMLVATLNGLIDKYHMEGELLGEVAGGAVVKSSRESNLIRESVMNTSFDQRTPACDIQQACATGTEAAIYIANKIALGQIDVGIAAGVDSASQVPLELGDKLRRTIIAAGRSKTITAKLKEYLKLRLADFKPIHSRIDEPKTGLSMGGHTDITARYYNISREEQDAYVLESHRRMAKAYDDHFFDDMITSYLGLDKDNNLRRDSSLEKLAKLKPSFDKINGTLTAGNSSPLTDGGACVLLASEEWAKKKNLPVLAYITHAEVAAIEYVKNRQNLLLAPVYAATSMLRRTGLRLQDFDYYEVHEAFAAQVLTTIKVWANLELSKDLGLENNLGPIDMSKVNVTGSSIPAGHPFAATGARIIATLAKLLYLKGSGRGFISVCAARGQGVTMILEKP